MKVNELRDKIIAASQGYYSGKPSISDDEFDILIRQLEELSPGDELLRKISTGYTPDKDVSGVKAKHKYMTVGSLNKINAETCEKYFEKRPGQSCITSKIDGGSIVCYYDSLGILQKAITRGNGEIGIDCTSKIKHIVPSSVNLVNIAIRGEIIMSKQNFERYYPDASSPRNTALGIIGKDDPDPSEIDLLCFVAYNVYGNNDLIPTKKSEVMHWLEQQGFTTAKFKFLFLDSCKIENLEPWKGKLNPEFPADGLVITNELNRFGEIAYKFIAETAETTVTKVEWETSRLGNVIPVVHFNPVKLSGAMLGKCSGFNAKWICDNRIGPFSKIAVHRAGEVIPYIKEVLKMGSHSVPTTCPDCGEKLIWKGVNLYCPNHNCSKKTTANLLHWIEIMAPIDSLGENILIPFLANMGWKTINKIYEDSFEEIWDSVIIEGCRFSEHAGNLLWQMYDKLYNQPVDPAKFFVAFGLPAVGMNTSKRIADEIGIDKFFSGDVMPEEINALSRKTEPAIRVLSENFGLLKRVYQQIKLQQGFATKEIRKDSIRVAITGKLSKGRKELAEEFAEHGIDVASSVSKDVSYLVTDSPESGSSKNTAAQKLGVKVVSETEFRSIMKI